MSSVKSAKLHKATIGTGLLLVFLSLSACASVSGSQAMDYNATSQTATSEYKEAPTESERATYTSERTASADLGVRYLPIGETVAAPTGFLELCSRSPVDCLHSEKTDLVAIRTEARLALADKYMIALNAIAPRHKSVDSADITTVASITPQPSTDTAVSRTTDAPRRLIWAAHVETVASAFGNAAMIKADSAARLPEAIVSQAEPKQLSHEFISYVAPLNDPRPGAISNSDQGSMMARLNWATKSTGQSNNTLNPASMPARPAGQVDYLRINLTRDMQTLIRNINDTVNQTLIADTDEHIYHAADYWAAPGLFRGKRADCEDFALQKRRMLIESGIPAAALSMAVVRTRTGDDHAVLVISTYQGDFVLDNLQFSVKAWQKTDYTWISRQGPGDDLTWVSLKQTREKKTPLKSAPVMIAYAQ